ncbi:MAG: hypothetical protein MUF00_04680 [Gemmatimonadaceae bacterium]|jgi:hypothetical protein|nr:hypothetical protein [Gemmatimonadaceae bacterium]
MANRDWDAELKKIDQQLSSLSDEQLRAPAPAAPGGRGAGAAVAGRSALPAPAAAVGAPSAGVVRGAPWLAYLRALIAAGGVAGLVLWPYTRSCGPVGAAYVASAGVVALAGLWAMLGGWSRRSALVHGVGLLSLLSAAVLAGLEVLPKVGYAIPTVAHPATWQCDVGGPASPGVTAPLTTPGTPAPSPAPGATTPPPKAAPPLKL